MNALTEMKTMSRLLTFLMFLLAAPSGTHAGENLKATMFKRPYCSCCDGHAEHLRANGFEVKIVQTEKLDALRQQHNVPQRFEGCHTLLIDGYVVEGHVPASVIHTLLKQRPRIRGISLPGMPDGSPGMSGKKTAPFVIYEIKDGALKVFARE